MDGSKYLVPMWCKEESTLLLTITNYLPNHSTTEKHCCNLDSPTDVVEGEIDAASGVVSDGARLFHSGLLHGR
jgi:hypothetical protein